MIKKQKFFHAPKRNAKHTRKITNLIFSNNFQAAQYKTASICKYPMMEHGFALSVTAGGTIQNRVKV